METRSIFSLHILILGQRGQTYITFLLLPQGKLPQSSSYNWEEFYYSGLISIPPLDSCPPVTSECDFVWTLGY